MAGSAFYAAISGLRANQTKLDVVSNNIANLNTFGFKSSRITFSDLLSQTIRAGSSPQGSRGGINPLQVGLGVQVASIDNIMQQGSIQSTGNIRDLAIDGAGFFVLEGEGGRSYSRAGNFTVDYTGKLVTTNGERIQGYTLLNRDGTAIDPSSPLGDIQINFGAKIPARTTTFVNYRSNLDSSSDTFGTARLASAGSTGFTLAAGIASPLASFRGNNVTTNVVLTDAGPGDITIDGTDVIFNWPGGFDFTDANNIASFVVNQINTQVPTVYARVVNGSQIEIESLFGNGASIIVSGNPANLGELGLSAGTFQQPIQGPNEAGVYNITVREATNASGTTTRPVPAGLLAPETIIINNVSITYGPTSSANTAAQNAQVIADAINAATSASPTPTYVQATANANGTISLRNTLAGANNLIAIEDPGASGNTGLDTIGTFTLNPFPGAPDGPSPLQAYVLANGSDAFVRAEYTADNGVIQRTREFFNSPPFGSASSLSNLGPQLLGDNAPLPLIPGVTLTADVLRNGQARIVTADAFTHSTTIEVFDSAGAPHQFRIEFQHFDQNRWKWTASLPAEPNIVLNNDVGFIDFGNDGLIASPNPLIPVSFTPPGANTVDLELRFDGGGSPIEGVTQFASESTTAANFQDGYPLGVLQSFAFDITGTIQGSFSNGLTRPLGQLALANFNNPAGLQRIGNNAWAVSANSGVVTVTRPGSGGAGTIIPGSLEQSNVDLAFEFTELIQGQRGFQANTRVITTQDEILGEVVNLVR